MWDYNVLDLAGATLPAVSVTRVASIGEHGFDAHSITVSTLTATYTETAAHVCEGARVLDDLQLTELIRPARLMRVPVSGRRGLIRREDLERHDPGLQRGEALIIDTGWGSRWDQPGYVRDAPAFSASTLDWFREQPISTLVLDTPVMECLWCGEEGLADEQADLLAPLYERGMVLIAPVVNLDRIQQSTGTLLSLPLAVENVCSAPSRVLFIEGVNWAQDIGDQEASRASQERGSEHG